jgi:hypothetical protein
MQVRIKLTNHHFFFLPLKINIYKRNKNSAEIKLFWELQVEKQDILKKIRLLEKKCKLLEKKQVCCPYDVFEI